MMPFTIGRKTELAKLENMLKTNKAEFLAVYGRRRVGKTHLIKYVIDKQKSTTFEVTGKKNGTLKEELSLFTQAMEKNIRNNFTHSNTEQLV